VSLNEVGGDPDAFGVTGHCFPRRERRIAPRAGRTRWSRPRPTTTSAPRTFAARIDVLSEMPAAWRLLLRRWRTLNRSRRALTTEKSAPGRQTTSTCCTRPCSARIGRREQRRRAGEYTERIERYMVKAAPRGEGEHELDQPDTEYEAALCGFVRAVLGPAPNPFLLDDLAAQARRVAWFGALNSLSLALLKFTSPGVPDLYQGNELLDFSLVDPDNRRPVDITAAREEALAGLDAADPRSLAEYPTTGVRSCSSPGACSNCGASTAVFSRGWIPSAARERKLARSTYSRSRGNTRTARSS
jgi:(1->4)-alpha-D-glucan 1-alpha-D-glucosylmutase